MSRRAKVTIGIIVILVLGGGVFWVWNKWTGRFNIGADVITGCQNPSQISRFLGRPGSNLDKYDLFGKKVSVNKKMIPFLDSVQRDVNAAKTGYNFDNVQTFNIRSKIWGGGTSLHSWAIAIDINPPNNPYQPGKLSAATTDIPQPVIDIFKKYGFAWGGDWQGQRDPMHFEWYGAELNGSLIDEVSKQKITDAAIFVNGSGAPHNKGDFDWILEARSHEIVVKARGYEDAKVKVDLPCFQTQRMDIALKPLSSNIPGRISGTVRLVGDRAPLIPATIYLDDKAVGATNVKGDYIINNVRSGKHKVEARVMFFPGEEVNTGDLVPGEDIKNLNITIGQQ